jgi:predicted transcriptional regulator
LETLTGNRPAEQEQSVTNSILTILKAHSGPLSTAQIIQRLTSMGHTPQPTSVATVLSRLAQQGKIMKADDGYEAINIDLENPKTLVDALLLVIKASEDGESQPASEFAKRLAQLLGGLPVKQEVIEWLLSDLANRPDRLIGAYRSALGESGYPVYHWLGNRRTKAEQTAARKAVVGINQIGLGRAEATLFAKRRRREGVTI